MRGSFANCKGRVGALTVVLGAGVGGEGLVVWGVLLLVARCARNDHRHVFGIGVGGAISGDRGLIHIAGYVVVPVCGKRVRLSELRT